jgi:hypothetical protein
VLNDVDRSLRSLIEAVVATADGPPAVSFAPPTPEWTEAQDGPVLNLFLYDVREDLDGQSSDEIDIRDHDGKVIGRLPPPRKYQLSYLASAWCDEDAEAEHELLGSLLATVPNEPGIPADHLTDRLAGQGLPVRIKVGVPVTGANTWDLWSALGTPPRTAIEIVVTAPLVPGLRTDLAPPAVKFELGVTKEPPGAIGPDETGLEGGERSEPEEPAEGAAPAASRSSKRSKDGKAGRKGADEDDPGPELEARPGKRWTTFRVREQAVPAPSSD